MKALPSSRKSNSITSAGRPLSFTYPPASASHLTNRITITARYVLRKPEVGEFALSTS
jgi:hypothetical protein